MTPWVLDYTPGAIQELADFWTRSPDRDAVTAAATIIDRELERDP